MTHRLYILIIAVSELSVFLIGCEDRNSSDPIQTYISNSNNPGLVWLLKGDYRIVKSFYELPEDVQAVIFPKPPQMSAETRIFLPKQDGKSLSFKEISEIVDGHMAEPNEKFNATDQILDVLPSRRFITGGYSRDYAFVFYERGGINYHTPLVIVSRSRGEAKVIFMGGPWREVKSFDELRLLIKNHKICEIKDPGTRQINL